MKEYTLSFIIPAYNAQQYIERAICSIISQPCFENTQIIVVNDGSEDATETICREYEGKYNNIYVYNKQNGGVASARNAGIELATGLYIAFLDADDWITQNILNESLYETLNEKKYDIYVFSYKLCSFDLQFEKQFPISSYQKEYSIQERCDTNWYPFSWGYFYKRFLIIDNDVRLFPVRYNEDISFAVRLFWLARSVYQSGKIMYVYYSNNDSAMHKKNFEAIFDEHYRSLLMLKAWFAERGGAYDTNATIIQLLDQILPTLCVYKSYSYTKHFVNDGRFAYLSRCFEPELPVVKTMMNNVKCYIQNPFKYWIKVKVRRWTILELQHFLRKHRSAREMFNRFYYTRTGYMTAIEELEKDYIDFISRKLEDSVYE